MTLPESDPPVVGDSILYTVKAALGVELDYTGFDTDILMGINSSIMALMQLGVGVEDGLVVTTEEDAWADLLDDDVNVEAAKSYITLKTRLLFDPPATSFVIEAIKNQIEEFAWRLMIQKDPPIEV
jgi:hypothetical protein